MGISDSILQKRCCIIKDPKAVKIIEKYAPGLSKNPLIGMAKGMTLKAILGFPQAKSAGLTKEMLENVLGEINEGKEE